MKLMIASPVRNRAWILPEFLGALRQAATGMDASYYFLVNDSTDESEVILRSWPGARVEVFNTGCPVWRHNQYSFGNLAQLRNRILDVFLASDADYLFSIDSDVIVPVDALSRLLGHHRDIVAGLISNIPYLPPFQSWAHNFFAVLPDGGVGHPPGGTIPHGVLLPVVMTGAVALMSRRAIESGARYADHPQGEDIAFCEDLIGRGMELHVDTGVVCDHRMLEPGQ